MASSKPRLCPPLALGALQRAAPLPGGYGPAHAAAPTLRAPPKHLQRHQLGPELLLRALLT